MTGHDYRNSNDECCCTGILMKTALHRDIKDRLTGVLLGIEGMLCCRGIFTIGDDTQGYR